MVPVVLEAAAKAGVEVEVEEMALVTPSSVGMVMAAAVMALRRSPDLPSSDKCRLLWRHRSARYRPLG